ncbi:MAG: molecular chaperone TorD family protein [Magnetospirillum sp. WYHS-4]
MVGPAAGGPADFWAAVADDLASLAVLHDREPDAALLEALRAVGFPGNLGLRLTSEAAETAGRLLGGFFSGLADPVPDSVIDALAVDFADIYLTYGLRASPAESAWFDADGLDRQDSMFAVRAFYRRQGLVLTDSRKRPDDHIVHQLQFLGKLAEKGDSDAAAEAVRFLDEHPLRWVGLFAGRVASRAATPYFAGLALLTAAYAVELRVLLGRLCGEKGKSVAKRLAGFGLPLSAIGAGQHD